MSSSLVGVGLDWGQHDGALASDYSNGGDGHNLLLVVGGWSGVRCIWQLDNITKKNWRSVKRVRT